MPSSASPVRGGDFRAQRGEYRFVPGVGGRQARVNAEAGAARAREGAPRRSPKEKEAARRDALSLRPEGTRRPRRPGRSTDAAPDTLRAGGNPALFIPEVLAEEGEAQ